MKRLKILLTYKNIQTRIKILNFVKKWEFNKKMFNFLKILRISWKLIKKYIYIIRNFIIKFNNFCKSKLHQNKLHF